MRWGLLMLAALAAPVAHAVEVISVAGAGTIVTIGPSYDAPWTVGEPVCFFRGPAKVSCGWISKRVYEGAQVRLFASASPDGVRARDSVERADVPAAVFSAVPEKKQATITHTAQHRWQMGDTVCVYRKQDPMGCGEVAKSEPFSARVDFFWASGTAMMPGDEVREAPGKSRVASVSDTGGGLVVGQPVAKPWRVGETLGVIKSGEPIAWGEVVKVFPLSAEVQIVFAKAGTDEGDWVKPLPIPPEVSSLIRPQAPERDSASVTEGYSFKDDRREIFTAGFRSLMPALTYERAVFPRVTVGGMMLIAGQALGGGRISGVGALGTITYYPKVYPAGLWMQMAIGMGPLTLARAGVRDSFLSTYFEATGGWRWKWPSGLVAGAGFGAIILPTTSTSRIDLNHSGIIPAVQLDVGMIF